MPCMCRDAEAAVREGIREDVKEARRGGWHEAQQALHSGMHNIGSGLPGSVVCSSGRSSCGSNSGAG